ncbi:hypothetical protein B7G68_17830 [Caulobacter segnis]|nr:hypothetical protein B7G68_17830 [Caulobacter segnis]
MDKLKATVSYKQFDAPRAGDQAWPILEKMAQAKSALSRAVSPVAAPVAPIEAAPAAPPAASPAARVADVLVSEAPAEGSLFSRLQADTAPAKAAAFSRYGAAKPVEDAPQALSEIFERIGRKAL